ncbi:hypothetical protein KDM87_09865 [Undibacterium sp. FT147W]|uniref:Uncharacterized protein n=1 Tax=Undibacterium rivi TaxID=2828729 RepID=A0ABS5H2F6_9BURK|nr:hypothetical protein [Undibacterium rivi]MBR7792901.1 hypothetical protein [Undibacterium rivi]
MTERKTGLVTTRNIRTVFDQKMGFLNFPGANSCIEGACPHIVRSQPENEAGERKSWVLKSGLVSKRAYTRQLISMWQYFAIHITFTDVAPFKAVFIVRERHNHAKDKLTAVMGSHIQPPQSQTKIKNTPLSLRSFPKQWGVYAKNTSISK